MTKAPAEIRGKRYVIAALSKCDLAWTMPSTWTLHQTARNRHRRSEALWHDGALQPRTGRPVMRRTKQQNWIVDAALLLMFEDPFR